MRYIFCFLAGCLISSATFASTPFACYNKFIPDADDKDSLGHNVTGTYHIEYPSLAQDGFKIRKDITTEYFRGHKIEFSEAQFSSQDGIVCKYKVDNIDDAIELIYTNTITKARFGDGSAWQKNNIGQSTCKGATVNDCSLLITTS